MCQESIFGVTLYQSQSIFEHRQHACSEMLSSYAKSNFSVFIRRHTEYNGIHNVNCKTLMKNDVARSAVASRQFSYAFYLAIRIDGQQTVCRKN